MRFPIFLVGFFLANSHLIAQNINVSPIPNWVKPIEFNFNTAEFDSISSSGGYYDLLIDDQYNLIEHQNYFHYAQLITSEKGLENISTLTQIYDPAYQVLTFHMIRIIRHGKIIDQLRRDKVQIIRREENMERFVYDGSLTAVFHFENLQVGDIIEYAISYKGYNPILPQFSRSFYFNYGVPVAKIYTRVLAEKSRHINIKRFNNSPSETILIKGDQAEYSWQTVNVRALLYDQGTPNWYEPSDRVDFSEFNSWAEVANWGSKLYSHAFATSPAIEGKLASFKREEKIEEAINKCVRFVQDEVRYLSFSDGIHGYKPHPASQVLSQLYGDCKDKSVLLVLMLRGLGLRSHPVLVHSSGGKLLSELLPSPRNFDHCIVEFQLNDSTYWIDPTMNLQRGSLKKRFTPDYAFGLVLKAETTSLTPISHDSKDSYIYFKEKFDVAKVGTSATLFVDIEYHGDEANSIRDYFRSTSLDEVTKSYLNFYATDYPNIEAQRSVSFDDNEVENVLTSHEKYFISSFWKYDSTYGKYSVNIYPRTLASYFPKPSTKIRTMPYAIAYPRNVDYEIKLKMPEPWSTTKIAKSIETSGFQYKSASNYKDSVVTLNYTFKAKKSYLDAVEISEHLQKVDDAINDLSIDLTYTETKAASNKFNYPFAIILLGISVFLYFGLKKCYEFDPEPKPSPERYVAIGGWLILPSIGLCIAPLRLVYFIYDTGFFNYVNWQILADAAYVSYNPNLGMLVLTELIINFVLCAFGVLVIVLFFKMRSSVPLLVACFYGANFLLPLIDSLIADSLNLSGFDKETTSNLLTGFISSAIWIPYFLISNRSKGTFTVRRGNEYSRL